VIASPDYPSTEGYTFSGGVSGTGSTAFWQPTQFHFHDLRQGIQSDVYNDWLSSSDGANYKNNNMGDSYGPARVVVCNWRNIGLTSGTGEKGGSCTDEWINSTVSGWSIGNPLTGNQFWRVFAGRRMTLIDNGSGIAQLQNETLNKYGVGDSITHYFSLVAASGNTATSDEGIKGFGNNVTAQVTEYAGACATGCSDGSTHITTTATAGGGTQGTQRYIWNDTVGPAYSGTITSMAAGLNASTEAVTVNVTGGTIPTVSNAWGTMSANLNTPAQNQQPWATQQVFNVAVTSGTFDTSSLMCFGGEFHEQVIPTSISNPSGPTATITANLRFPHNSGSLVMQGSCAGMDLPNYWSIGGFRYLADVLGVTSVAGSTAVLQVTFFRLGTSAPAPENIGLFSSALYSFYNMSSLSSTTSTLNFTYTAAGSTIGTLSYGTIYITGSTDNAYNNKICTSVVFTSSTAGSCTISGLSGTHSSATAVANIAGPGPTPTGPVNAFSVYQIAQVTDVLNFSTVPPSVDGTFWLEPNTMKFTAGNSIVESVPLAQRVGAQTNTVSTSNIGTVFTGITLTGVGQGIAGGNDSVTSNCWICLTSNNGDNNYLGTGGIQTPANAFSGSLQYNHAFLFNHGPAQTGTNSPAFIYIAPTTAQQADPNYCFPVILSKNSGGANQLTLTICPNSGNFSLGTNGTLLFGGSSTTFQSATTFQQSITANGTASILGSAGVSASNLLMSGAIQHTGTGTTNFPAFFIQPSGTTAATTWNTGGTGIGINALSTVMANFLDFHNNGGASLFSVANSTGNVNTAGQYQVGGVQIASTNLSDGASLAPKASPAFTGTPTAPTAAATDNSTTLATTAFVRSIDLVASLTTTAATTDNVTVTGMTASGHCSLTATNASAATNIATTYISAKTTNQITVTHTATASMSFDVLCTPY